mmetsp:Transcript_53925/g.144300  ORF Transcript_53925/g.144300 Transcript_53925/m.144300 type:complete len:210 (+) Transcript_53925:245-874(+)
MAIAVNVHHLIGGHVERDQPSLMKDEHAHQGHGDALENTHDYKEWIVNEQLTNSILILGKLSASGEKTPDMPNLSQCFNDGQHHESPVVPFANGNVKPYTIVVEFFDTCTRHGTVLRTSVFQHPRCGAEARHVRQLLTWLVQCLHKLLHTRLSSRQRPHRPRVRQCHHSKQSHGKRSTNFEEHCRIWRVLPTQRTYVRDVLEEGQRDTN